MYPHFTNTEKPSRLRKGLGRVVLLICLKELLVDFELIERLVAELGSWIASVKIS